jgi:hypothetical protein
MIAKYISTNLYLLMVCMLRLGSGLVVHIH